MVTGAGFQSASMLATGRGGGVADMFQLRTLEGWIQQTAEGLLLSSSMASTQAIDSHCCAPVTTRERTLAGHPVLTTRHNLKPWLKLETLATQLVQLSGVVLCGLGVHSGVLPCGVGAQLQEIHTARDMLAALCCM
jgi:hypothetical protein